MSLRYFTVQEANELLPELEPLVGRVLTLRARASHHSREMGALLADLSSDIGGSLPSRLTGEFAEIEELIERIQSYGIVLKSLEAVSYTHLDVYKRQEWPARPAPWPPGRAPSLPARPTACGYTCRSRERRWP